MTSGKRFFSAHWPILLILLLSAFLLFFRLNRDLLADWDECVYSVHAVEMKQTGYFLANQWNGYVDLQKPPLYTWLLQGVYGFGVNEFNTRVLSVLFGLLLIVSIYSFCSKYFTPQTGIVATLLLLTIEIVIITSRTANTDIGFALLVFCGIFFWMLSAERGRFVYLSGFTFGLAVLLKGLGVIPFFAAIFLSISFEPGKKRFIDFFKVLATFLATIAPWHLLAYSVYGEKFLNEYFFESIMKRSQFALESHEGPWYKYLSQFKRMLFPWIYVGALFPIRFAWQCLTMPIQELLKKERVALTIMLVILLPLISISIMKTKLAWYTLPIYPFLVIYLSYNIKILVESFPRRRLIQVLFIAFIGGHAFLTITRETKMSTGQRKLTPRYEAFLKAANHPQPELQYLIEPGVRAYLLGLKPEERLPNTLVFGSNPCAVHYTQKRVRYYYSSEEFKQKLNRLDGLFLVEKGDQGLIQNASIKILLKNEQYTLFESVLP